MNHRKQTITDVLADISVKHHVFVGDLFAAVILASKLGKSNCDKLSIECRGNVDAETIFLITKDSCVVAQFRVTQEFLDSKDLHFERWMSTDRIRRKQDRQFVADHSLDVHELRDGMKNVKIIADVLETRPPEIVYSQYGTRVKLINAWIGDVTGKVRLCLWNDQGNSISAGDTVQISGASVATFRGERQLKLGKSGVITVLQNQTEKISLAKQ